MDQESVEWSSLSKKERKRLIKERKRQELEIKNKRGGIIKWVIIAIILILLAWGVMWFIKEASKPLPGSALPNQGRDHVSKEVWGKFKYNSNPPISGPHDAVWTKLGVYDQPQGDGHLVHSLEHGYIIISHNCPAKQDLAPRDDAESSKFNPSTSLRTGVQSSKLATGSAEMDKGCLDFVNKLKERLKKDSSKLILVPRPNLDTNFALTAWTRIDKFKTEEASMERVNNFIDSLRNHGPEQTME